MLIAMKTQMWKKKKNKKLIVNKMHNVIFHGHPKSISNGIVSGAKKRTKEKKLKVI